MAKQVYTRETYHCDICNKELPARYSDEGIQYIINRIENYDHPHSGGSQSTDKAAELCKECGMLMLDYLRAKPAKAVYEIEGLRLLVLKK